MDSYYTSASKAFIKDIISKTKSVSQDKGLGVFYWEPQSYDWAGYTKGAFSNGKPTEAMDGFLESNDNAAADMYTDNDTYTATETRTDTEANTETNTDTYENTMPGCGEYQQTQQPEGCGN
jgi:arabinogalactan endo-1,4-beta-galactosidase